jgi:hypothetical protein
MSDDAAELTKAQTRLLLRFGRNASQGELAAEKAARVAAKKSPEHKNIRSDIVVLDVYRVRRQENNKSLLVVVEGSMSLIKVRMKLKDSEPTQPSFKDLLTRIGEGFPGGNAWHLFVGSDIISASPVKTQDAFVDAVAIAVTSGQGPVAYAMEALASSGSGGAFLSPDRPRVSLASSDAPSTFTCHARVDELAASLGLAPTGRGKSKKKQPRSKAQASSAQLANAAAELTKLENGMAKQKYSQAGKPLLALSNGRWDETKQAYEPLAPSDLKEEDVGALTGKYIGKLGLTKQVHIVCLHPKCAIKQSGRPYKVAVKVKCFNGKGEMRLESLEAIIDTHINRDHGKSLADDHDGKPKNHTGISSLAQGLGFVAAMANHTTASISQLAAAAATPPATTAQLSPIDMGTDHRDHLLLKLPFESPDRGSYESRYRAELYASMIDDIKAFGNSVGSHIFNVLRREEEATFLGRIAAASKEGLARKVRVINCEPFIQLHHLIINKKVPLLTLASMEGVMDGTHACQV